MSLRFVGAIIVCFLLVSLMIVAVLLGPGLLAQRASGSSAQGTAASSTSNPIVTENAHFGTTAWRIPVGSVATTQIQAYAGATSVLPGQQLSLYVSTSVAGTRYFIAIYRLGWYQGFGARLMTTSGNLVGSAQGTYDSAMQTLVDCNSCRIQARTGLIEANWQPSYTLTIPSDWISGIYLAKFTDEHGMQTYTPFVVRSSQPSLYLAVTPDTTYAAYNTWGGYSLDTGTPARQRAVKVSFDRPYVQGEGASQVLTVEAPAIHWLERQGYDISYISNVDLHQNPAQLLLHHAYLSLGHDAYWTKEMRDGVERARNSGVGLAFLGAQASYWQMRFEPDSAGLPDRTVVCYKVAIQHGSSAHPILVDLRRDPLYGKDTARLTAAWRDPVLARPENSLIGIMFSGPASQSTRFSWQLDPRAISPLLQGTGLQSGHPYGCDMVGSEWDRIFANGATPHGLQVLGSSPTIDDSGKLNGSNTTYYIAHSGALVFASGSSSWTGALDNYRLSSDPLCSTQNPVVVGVQRLMAKVMDELIILHPAGMLVA